MTDPQPTVEQIVSALADRQALSDKDMLDLIKRAIAKRPDADALVEALIVRLANLRGVSMHGRFLRDTVTDPNAPLKTSDAPKGDARNHYTIYPYTMPGANTSVTVVYTDAKTGAEMVLIGRRRKGWGTDPKAPISTRVFLPGGYMDPHPREGGKPGDSKGATKPNAKGYDETLADTAVRELEEETGLILPADVKPVFTGMRSRYRHTDSRLAHTVIGDYLIDLGTLDKPPATQAGDDVAGLVWADAAKIYKMPGIAAQKYGSVVSRYWLVIDQLPCTLRDDHGEALEAALRSRRDAHLLAETGFTAKTLAIATAMLEQLAGKPPRSHLALQPTAECGPEAADWNAQALAVAKRLKDNMARDAGRLLADVPPAPPPTQAIHPLFRPRRP